jgi:hypothetical protein
MSPARRQIKVEYPLIRKSALGSLDLFGILTKIGEIQDPDKKDRNTPALGNLAGFISRF